MSTKSAQNGRAVAATRPAAAKAPADRQASAADRIRKLEADVAELRTAVDTAGRILAGMIEQQAVQAAMPAIEQQIRSQVQQAYAQGGLAALAPGGPPQAQEAPPMPPTPQMQGQG
jgi:hypothetical protein